MIKNVLIGSNGGLTGVYLAKCFGEMEDIYLFGADCNEITAGKFFVNKQLILPNASSVEFVDALIDLLIKYEIDYYIPTHSLEIKTVSKNSEKIKRATATKFIVSPYDTFVALDNKVNMNENLLKLGVPTPRRILDSKNAKFPILMKKNIGSGSSGLYLIKTDEEFALMKTIEKDSDFYENIKGSEFTVDCMFDFTGKLLILNQRRREKTIGGAVSITCTDNSFDIQPWIEKISNRFKMCGCVNFQYILKDGIPYFIDINLRYPSGGLPLTVMSGANIPAMLLDILDDVDMESKSGKVLLKPLRMYRYFEEIYEEI